MSYASLHCGGGVARGAGDDSASRSIKNDSCMACFWDSVGRGVMRYVYYAFWHGTGSIGL